MNKNIIHWYVIYFLRNVVCNPSLDTLRMRENSYRVTCSSRTYWDFVQAYEIETRTGRKLIRKVFSTWISTRLYPYHSTRIIKKTWSFFARWTLNKHFTLKFNTDKKNSDIPVPVSVFVRSAHRHLLNDQWSIWYYAWKNPLGQDRNINVSPVSRTAIFSLWKFHLILKMSVFFFFLEEESALLSSVLCTW